MTLQKEERLGVIRKFQSYDGSSDRSHVLDTGCLEVQIALWTRRIEYLTEHFKTHKKDHHSRRGLIHLVNKRRNSLNYLKRKSFKRYKTLLARLKIRK